MLYFDSRQVKKNGHEAIATEPIENPTKAAKYFATQINKLKHINSSVRAEQNIKNSIKFKHNTLNQHISLSTYPHSASHPPAE